jgi:hypothetical protein
MQLIEMESRFFSLVLALQRRHQWSVDKHLRRSFCRTRAGHELFILDTAQKCLHQQRRCAYVTAGQGTDSSSSRHSESHGFSEFSECCHFLPIGSSQVDFCIFALSRFPIWYKKKHGSGPSTVKYRQSVIVSAAARPGHARSLIAR